MKITITDDNNQVLLEKVSAELSVEKTIAKVTAACRTDAERRAHALAQAAEIMARRTPEQVAEDERIAALTSEEREIEFAQKEKEMLEAQLAEVSDKVAVSLAAMSRKSAPVEKLAP